MTQVLQFPTERVRPSMEVLSAIFDQPIATAEVRGEVAYLKFHGEFSAARLRLLSERLKELALLVEVNQADGA
jgi:hypothetical protein